jgi:hypothetical protein
MLKIKKIWMLLMLLGISIAKLSAQYKGGIDDGYGSDSLTPLYPCPGVDVNCTAVAAVETQLIPKCFRAGAELCRRLHYVFKPNN